MAQQNFILPKLPNPKGQAELILKGAGLAFIKPKFYRVNINEIAKEQGDVNVNTFDTRKSKFGLPIFDEFRFLADEINRIVYKDDVDYGSGNTVIVTSFIFETALIEINQTKNIVKTAIAGQNGTVKEYMSQGDYIINLKGVVVGDVANQRPNSAILNNLIAFLRAPVSIPVSCAFLEEFHISSVVIESYKLGQREGARNIIDVEINMLSDSVIELTSKDKKDIKTERKPYVQRSLF